MNTTRTRGVSRAQPELGRQCTMRMQGPSMHGTQCGMPMKLALVLYLDRSTSYMDGYIS